MVRVVRGVEAARMCMCRAWGSAPHHLALVLGGCGLDQRCLWGHGQGQVWPGPCPSHRLPPLPFCPHIYLLGRTCLLQLGEEESHSRLVCRDRC